MLAPPDPSRSRKPLRLAARTIAIAADALEKLNAQFDEPPFMEAFERTVSLILNCRGRIVVTGMGKGGIVASKIAATFIATGTQALYLHAGDGGLGAVEPADIVLAVSRSGVAAELAPVISYCKRYGVPLILVTSSARASAARFADIAICLPSVREACSVKLTPTTSTTVQLVFGDALAMALIERRGFSADDFYKFHPSGRLGAQLLKVADLMTTGRKIPRVAPSATLIDATVEMTRARFGGTAVVDDNDMLIGAFTDGDLRRTITGGGLMTDRVGDWMTLQPSTIGPREFASEALRRMQGQSIMMLFVVEGRKVAGVLHMHDVLDAGTA